jgi:hypothetical protein
VKFTHVLKSVLFSGGAYQLIVFDDGVSRHLIAVILSENDVFVRI